MRTTVDLDDDTASEVQRLRVEEHRGLSDAVNELIRRAMIPREPRKSFVPTTRPLGIEIDVSNIADALDLLEGRDAR
jgi:hypothetical protein